MNLKNKLSRGQSTAIAAGLSVALIGGGVAVAQQISLPNQTVVAASAECSSVPEDASPIAIGLAHSSTWSENTPTQWGGEGLLPGGRVYRSYAVRNLDARPVKWTINLSESTSTPDAYFALGAAVGPVTADAATVEPSAISYPAAPAAPEAEKPADGFLWLIGSSVPTSLQASERGDLIAEVIIPSGSYVAITDWVAVPPGYEWSSPDQRIDPVWATTAQPGTLDDAGNFTPADASAPDFIPIGCDDEPTEEPPTQTQAELHDPVAVSEPAEITVGETPNAKSYVKDADKLPEGTTFSFDDADFSAPGDKKTTITVTYPDKSTDTVEVTIPVKAKPTQAELHDPVAVDAPKPVTAGETPEAKSYVKDADKLPEGTTFTFADADFSAPGDKKTTITVTYPDKSTDTVEVTIPVKAKPTQAELHDPVAVADPAEVTVGETPNAKDYIKDADKLPEGTTFEFTDADFSAPGDKKTTITVTYPDKSTDTVEVTIPVKAKPTQAELHDPVAVDVPKPVTAGEEAEAKEYVKGVDKLPEGTQFEFADPKPDFTKPGDKQVTITVKYPDGSTDEVIVIISVKAKEKTPEPQGSSFKDLSSECRSSIIGGSIGGVLGLLIAIVSQLNIPGLSDGIKAANTQIQIALGLHNPATAERPNNWVSIIGGIVGAMIFFTSAGVAIAKCKTELGSSD